MTGGPAGGEQTVATSHKEILRSSWIIGGAAIINIAVGLAKTKLVAVLLGPAGLGLIVLLQNLMQTVASAAGLSLGTAGTRGVAESHASGDKKQAAATRRALLIGSIALALLGGLGFWAMRDILWRWFPADAGAPSQMAWLALGIALSIGAQSQTALLMGFRRVGDVAKASVVSAVAAALVGVAAVLLWGVGGIMAFVLAAPLATFLVGHLYVVRLPKPPEVATSPRELIGTLKTMVRLGVALTVAAASVSAGQLAARFLIQHELGAAAVGHFQASWLVSITYIGFILQAMGTDFYPRVCGAIGDFRAVNRLINEQTEVALLLAGPVLLITLGGAPWIVQLLYSSEFGPAVTVLQWQILGDVLKVASWPLGYLLLARSAGGVYMAGEVLSVVVMLAVIAFGLPLFGLEISGVAVVALYLFYLPFVFLVGHRSTGFRWTRINIALLAGLLLACAGTMLVARYNAIAGAVAGGALGLAAGLLCLSRLWAAMPPPIAAAWARISPLFKRAS